MGFGGLRYTHKPRNSHPIPPESLNGLELHTRIAVEVASGHAGAAVDLACLEDFRGSPEGTLEGTPTWRVGGLSK